MDDRSSPRLRGAASLLGTSCLRTPPEPPTRSTRERVALMFCTDRISFLYALAHSFVFPFGCGCFLACVAFALTLRGGPRGR